MEALCVQPLEEDGVMMEEEEERGKSGELEAEGGMEASSPGVSTTDEETDDDSEPEPPPVVRRKVSFADAFGLNLVSVKEFDNVEVAEPEVSRPPEQEATHPLEEYYMSCLFTVPSSSEELDRRLQVQMIELESIELLPGTTTLRGIIRVVNLCYGKTVYVRVTLDCWNSYFDLLAEYVPGSSDRKTDRFTFKYILIPPFDREGTRVDFCLRYETSVGTFWSNNSDMNYVLFCHKRGHAKEQGPQVLEESSSYKSKRSCLKANRRGSAEEKTINTATVSAEAQATHKAEDAGSAETQSLLYREERKALVDSVKRRQRAARLARVVHYLSQRGQQVPKADSHVSANGQRGSQRTPAPWGDSAGVLHSRQKKQPNDGPQVLTYHEIPLLTLDWNNDARQRRGAADLDDMWTGNAKLTLSKASEEKNTDDTPSVNDMWETFLNGTDDTNDKEASVSDVWQEFLNGPSCEDHSGVPESEWLQTAASVSPSNDKQPQSQYAASSQELQEFQVGAETPAAVHAHASAARQPLSHHRDASPANVASDAQDHQPAEACVSSPGDVNTATRDASQRSQTNSVTDTLLEFCLKGATPVSEGSVDSSAECHKDAAWQRGGGGIIGEAGGTGEDEPLTPHTADLVTSSGESKTTDMTAMPGTQNASSVDRISQGARLDEGLSSSREGEAAGAAHNATGDTLAFRETIRPGTKDGERFVFPAARRGAEERVVATRTENKVSTEEEIFRPHKTEEYEISQRYADEEQCEEFRLNQKSENPSQERERDENEIGPAQSHARESSPNQTCEEHFSPSLVMESEFKLDESENKDMASNGKDVEGLGEAPGGHPCRTESEEAKRLIGAEAENIRLSDEGARQRHDNASQLNPSVWQRGNMLVMSEVHDKQSRPAQAGGELCVQKFQGEEEVDLALTQAEEKCETGEHVLASDQTEEGKGPSRGGVIAARQEINPPLRSTREVSQSENPAASPFPADRCSPAAAEGDVVEGQREDVGSEMSPEEVAAERESAGARDTWAEPRRQPETKEGTEEDMSQRDKDESAGELKIEATGGLMGNVEGPRGERENAPAELREREPSAEVEGPPRVERKELPAGTKEAITAENPAALQVMESGLEDALAERFGEDLVRGVWEEVFGRRAAASNRDTNTADGMRGAPADVPDITRDCRLLFERDLSDDFDSGVFSLTELPTDSSLCQTAVIGNDEERNRPPAAGEPTRPLSELDSDSSAHLGRDVAGRPPAGEARALGSPKGRENGPRTRGGPVARQETDGQTDDGAVARGESSNRPAHPPHKRPGSSSEKLTEPDGLVWWSILHALSHVTRLLAGGLLVAGFFAVVFLDDFPAFFALYVFSLCWWFYKWRRHQVAMGKGIGREFAERGDCKLQRWVR